MHFIILLHNLPDVKLSHASSSLQTLFSVPREDLAISPLKATWNRLLCVQEICIKGISDDLFSPVGQITETWAVGLLPNWVVQWKLHRPMRFHVGGTMLALALALQYGWSINLGGSNLIVQCLLHIVACVLDPINARASSHSVAKGVLTQMGS